MNNIFNRQNQQNQQNELYLIQRQYNLARYDLLLIIILSVVNVLMMSFGSDTYFLFSAYLPYSIVLESSIVTGRWPEEAYKEAGFDLKEYWGDMYTEVEPLFGAVFAFTVVIALVIVGFYLLCYFLSKKHPTWMIVSAAVFGIDTLLLVTGGLDGMILDLVLHIVVLAMLIRGCIYGRKLKAYNDAAAQNAQFAQNPYNPGFGANGDPYYGNQGQGADMYGNGQYMQNGQPNQFTQNQNQEQNSSANSNEQQNFGYTEFTPTSYNPDLTPNPGEQNSGSSESFDNSNGDSGDNGDDKKDGTL